MGQVGHADPGSDQEHQAKRDAQGRQREGNAGPAGGTKVSATHDRSLDQLEVGRKGPQVQVVRADEDPDASWCAPSTFCAIYDLQSLAPERLLCCLLYT